MDDCWPLRTIPEADPPPILENRASRDEPVDCSTWPMLLARGG